MGRADSDVETRRRGRAPQARSSLNEKLNKCPKNRVCSVLYSYHWDYKWGGEFVCTAQFTRDYWCASELGLRLEGLRKVNFVASIKDSIWHAKLSNLVDGGVHALKAFVADEVSGRKLEKDAVNVGRYCGSHLVRVS